MITSLFFLWGFVHNLDPILIPHLKKAFSLTTLQASLVDSAVFIAYFFMAIPAGLFMKKYGYKAGIIVGLLFFIFSLGMKDLGADTKFGSSLIIMSIVGGAFLPPIFGQISDVYHNIQYGYIVPFICFGVVLYFGLFGHKVKPLKSNL